LPLEVSSTDTSSGRSAREAKNPALETLRAVDIDRLTPLEALQLIASLKEMAARRSGV
jgi:hypothetical protein